MKNQIKLKHGNIRITAYGAAGEVGRSAFIIEDDKRKVLLEGGLKIQPGDLPTLAPEGLKERIYQLDAAVLSHAHVDHSGYLPALWENGYFGNLYMTTPTLDIVTVLWKDHLKIEGNRHWTPAGMERAYNNTITVPYHKKTQIVDGVTLEFFNSGHILGGAMILLDWDGYKILYTGDINDQLTPLFEGYELPDIEVDVLITESTNGCRDITPRMEVNLAFIKKVRETLEKGNKVIVPSFALGRSQEILCVLTDNIKDYPIYVDGMINTMNGITERYLSIDWIDPPLLERMSKEGITSPFRYNNVVPISRHNPQIENTHDFRQYLGQLEQPCIIVTTSGMMEPSPIHTHLRYSARYPNNLIAITGYQAQGTRGREILDGARKVSLSVDWDYEEEVEIKAEVLRFGFSGHTSVEGITNLIEHVKPKQIFLVHGDPKEQSEMSSEIENGVIPVSLEPKKTITLFGNGIAKKIAN